MRTLIRVALVAAELLCLAAPSPAQAVIVKPAPAVVASRPPTVWVCAPGGCSVVVRGRRLSVHVRLQPPTKPAPPPTAIPPAK